MSYNVSDWMWIVGNTSPTTQVYSSAAGGMIANNSAAFLTWLSGRAAAIAIGDHDGYAIGGATDNGSGLIRLTVTTTARMQNNQRWAVAASGSANVDGNWPITVVNATQIDLQGSNSAYAGAVTGGYVLGATFIDTMANLTSVLNRAAFTRFQEATKSFTSAVDLALDNPLAATSLINITAAGKSVTLPAMNAVNSVPVGIPFVMVNTGAFAFTLKDKFGTALGELAPQASWQLINTTNATIAGAFQTIVTLYNSGTGGILQTAPKTDTAAAQGSWTHLAHQSNPGQFDGRNNEVWGFGYNLSNAWSSRNGLDDGIGMGWETHYHPSSGIGPQFEAHLCRVGKKGGGEFRPLSFFIQKFDTTATVGAYWTAGSVTADEFNIVRPSNNAAVFSFNTHVVGTPTSKGQAFFVDADLTMEGGTLTNGIFQSFNQKNASFDIVIQYQFSGTSKWLTTVKRSTFEFKLYDNVAGADHTTWYSSGGVAIGAPTGGNKGFGTLNATGLYLNNVAVLTGNQTITLGGDVTGSGTTSITTTLGNGTVSTSKMVDAAVTDAKLAAGTMLVEARRTTDQTVTANTWTKIQLSTEDTDVENIFDPTTNYRATPTKAGLYLVHVHCNMNCADGGYGAVAIYKNGTHYAANFAISGANQVNGVSVTAFASMNGSSDYIEAYGFSSDTVTPKFTGGSVSINMRIMRIH
jgi:hypothetical protein